MKKNVVAVIGLTLFVSAPPALADMYRLSDRIGMGSTAAFNLSNDDSFGYGLHGEYTVGLYSWSHSIFAQTDYSVDIFHTELEAVNWSLIVTRDFGEYKIGGFVGAFMQTDTDIHFSAGATAMLQLGSDAIVQGEIGALTNGRDNAIFINNIYFGQIRVDYDISETYGVYAKYSRLQRDTFFVNRGVLGITYSQPNSPWILNGGIGAFHDSQGYYPLLSAEFKYEFGGDPLPQQLNKLSRTYFDKFEIFDFNVQ